MSSVSFSSPTPSLNSCRDISKQLQKRSSGRSRWQPSGWTSVALRLWRDLKVRCHWAYFCFITHLLSCVLLGPLPQILDIYTDICMLFMSKHKSLHSISRGEAGLILQFHVTQYYTIIIILLVTVTLNRMRTEGVIFLNALLWFI